jgi:hypothetical protein
MAQELSVLSPRELEVLKLVAEGQTNLLARDALYTEEVEKQAATLHLTRIQVNGSAVLMSWRRVSPNASASGGGDVTTCAKKEHGGFN